jgi:hypothetical protein
MLHSSTARSFVHRAFERFPHQTIMRRAFRASQGIECHSLGDVDTYGRPRASTGEPSSTDHWIKRMLPLARHRSQSSTGGRKLNPVMARGVAAAAQHRTSCIENIAGEIRGGSSELLKK